jgi:arylsulfatase A-like enzyme/Tfp pilus assembly protein PilF
VVIVSIDTLRSDHLPVYGYSGVATPAIDALRADSILFSRAYSQVPLTLPSHASMFSGRLPSEHGVRDNVGYRVAPQVQPWLPEIAAAQGYATAGFVSAYVLRSETGMSRGWATWDDDVRPRPDLPLGGLDRPGKETLEAALTWLRGIDHKNRRPFLLFVHFYEPHRPYTPPEPFRTRYAAAPYDGEIAEADRLVGELVAGLRALDVYDPALILLLSDHGEGLGDHGEDEHGVLVYREALQVPLIAKLPRQDRAGSRVDAAAQTIDLLPTLAGVFGAQPPAGLHGNSLLSLPDERALYAESYYGRLQLGWHPLRSLIARGHHYIDSPEPEIFDLEKDPRETRNLIDVERRLAAESRSDLRRYSAPLQPPTPETEETRRQLAALGYLSGGVAAGREDSKLPAPQTHIGALRDLERSATAVREGRNEEARRTLETVVRDNPLMIEAWSLFGTANGAAGDWQGALDAFERAFDLAGRDPNRSPGVVRSLLELGKVPAASQLLSWAIGAGLEDAAATARIGRRLIALGHAGEAERLLRQGAANKRLSAPCKAALAELLASSGRWQEAIAYAQQAVIEEPRDGDGHEQLALAFLQGRQWASAREAARRAVDLDRSRANAWNHLGVAAYSLGQRTEALEAWRRAVDLAPGLFDAWFNLGIVAAEAGDREQARWALRRFLDGAPAKRFAADFPRVRGLLAQLERDPMSRGAR